MDSSKNFAKSDVSTGYDAVVTSIVLATGGGAKMPSVPFNAVWWDTTYADPSDDPNVEVIRVTNVSTDTLTITRAQESTSAATHNTANHTYRIIAALTSKTLTDISTALAACVQTSRLLTTTGPLTIAGGLSSDLSADRALAFNLAPCVAPPNPTSGVSTTLSVSITNADVSLTLISATGFPAAPFLITIGTEDIKVGARSGTSCTSLTRGYNGTSAASHTSGDTITLTNWEWNNQGASTVTRISDDGRLYFTAPATAGSSMRTYKRLIPNTSSGVLTVGLCGLLACSTTNAMSVGITLREVSSDKRVLFYAIPTSSGPKIEIAKGTGSGFTSASSDLSTLALGFSPVMWFRVSISGSNYVYAISPDPSAGFLTILTIAKTTQFTSAADEWGIYLNTGQTTQNMACTLVSFSET